MSKLLVKDSFRGTDMETVTNLLIKAKKSELLWEKSISQSQKLIGQDECGIDVFEMVVSSPVYEIVTDDIIFIFDAEGNLTTMEGY